MSTFSDPVVAFRSVPSHQFSILAEKRSGALKWRRSLGWRPPGFPKGGLLPGRVGGLRMTWTIWIGKRTRGQRIEGEVMGVLAGVVAWERSAKA
ncbi:hypothetical protein TIFTF001_003331 [Ficus carica]|uniref:Uncharacterized protein n=1 Tax=Ficus carica TaxID=3494 RepID=A0AA87ZGY0_FICCA|nr:hypothetical protein TIFTF001_003331 [Ficus carica]